MDRNIHQGHFGEHFVAALAAAAGLQVTWQHPDTDGIDLSLGYPGARGTIRSPRIDVQVKSCRSPEQSAGYWHYRLKNKHYENLAGPGFVLPRFLFLVVVPEQSEGYAHADDQRLELRKAGYWHSFADQPLIPGAQPAGKVLVKVAKKSLLTVESLLDLVTLGRPS